MTEAETTPVECWKIVPGYNGRLMASDRGQILSLSANFGWKVLRQDLTCWGYCRVRPFIDGRQRNISVHQLVLRAFRGPPKQGQECRHLDGCKTNNFLTNLKWGTRSENSKDQVRHGTAKCLRQFGADNPNARLNPVLVKLIHRYGDLPQRHIAKLVGLSQATVSRVLNHKQGVLC